MDKERRKLLSVFLYKDLVDLIMNFVYQMELHENLTATQHIILNEYKTIEQRRYRLKNTLSDVYMDLLDCVIFKISADEGGYMSSKFSQAYISTNEYSAIFLVKAKGPRDVEKMFRILYIITNIIGSDWKPLMDEDFIFDMISIKQKKR